MFLVLNKEKITAYIVSVLTVCFLLFVASNIQYEEKTEVTSTNVILENEYNTNNTNIGGNTKVK